MADVTQNGSGGGGAGIKVATFRAASILLQRIGLAGKLGMMFDGTRDTYKIYGYKRTLTTQDMVGKYMRQDIAKRVIDAPAKGVWKNPPTIVASDSFLKVWNDIVKRTKLWSKFERLDKLAGMGEYAVMLMGFDDGAAMDEQVAPGSSPRLLFLQPYSQLNAAITKWDDDPKSERFGLPETYELTTTNPEQLGVIGGNLKRTSRNKSSERNITVHHSRILHVAEDLLEDNVLGIPRMTAIYNLLDDFIKVVGGTAEMYWMAANRGMQFDLDKEIELSPEGEADLKNQVDEYVNGLSRILRTRGVEANPLGSDTPDPEEAFSMLVALLSGATGIPQRVLIGSEAGQLASEQDRSNWADRIAERQLGFGEDQVLMPFIQQLQAIGTLPAGRELEIIWPSAYRLSPLEQSQAAAQFGRAVANVAKSFESRPLITQEEAREKIGVPPEVPKGQTLIERVEPTENEPDNGDEAGATDSQEREADDRGGTPRNREGVE